MDFPSTINSTQPYLVLKTSTDLHTTPYDVFCSFLTWGKVIHNGLNKQATSSKRILLLETTHSVFDLRGHSPILRPADCFGYISTCWIGTRHSCNITKQKVKTKTPLIVLTDHGILVGMVVQMWIVG